MEPSEFAAARETLGLSITDFAREISITPDEVRAMEQGSIRVPKRIAKGVARRLVWAEREAVIRSSGLPECGTAEDMQSRMEAAPDAEKMMAIGTTLIAHAEQCATCRARADYLELHAPPIPEMEIPISIRAVGWVDDRVNQLPWPLRPPVGEGGEGRRLAVVGAVMLSAWVVVLGIVIAARRVILHGTDGIPGWDFLGGGALIFVSYFVGFFLAGWASDALHPIRHRFIGYVGRGAAVTTAIYGTIGLILPFMDRDMDWELWPVMTGIFAVIGAAIGAAMWLRDMLRGKLPASTTS